MSFVLFIRCYLITDYNLSPRRVWDSNMLESLEIGLLNVNNDVGYYASKSIVR